MSHIEFINTIKSKPSKNQFQISRFDPQKAEFVPYEAIYNYCIIGRNDDCQIRLKEDKCSRHHCIIYFTNDTLHVRDLDSRLGSYYGKCAGNEVMDKQQLLPFTPMHLEEHDCVIINNVVYRIDKIKLFGLNIGVPVNIQPGTCQFCKKPVQLYIKELQMISDQIQVLGKISINTTTILNQEEQKVFEIIKKLEQLSEAHKQFLKDQEEAAKEAEEPGINFKSKVSVINDNEEKPQGKKSAKSHEKTPFNRDAYGDEDE